ncbi:hypothetical protein BY996DRAFT_6421124 [Phakopsora pachyrhizi]|nr:hypothetical protein BY996DRAFT_6421124 [Phakopsora pachyrhizi]
MLQEIGIFEQGKGTTEAGVLTGGQAKKKFEHSNFDDSKPRKFFIEKCMKILHLKALDRTINAFTGSVASKLNTPPPYPAAGHPDHYLGIKLKIQMDKYTIFT